VFGKLNFGTRELRIVSVNNNRCVFAEMWEMYLGRKPVRSWRPRARSLIDLSIHRLFGKAAKLLSCLADVSIYQLIYWFIGSQVKLLSCLAAELIYGFIGLSVYMWICCENGSILDDFEAAPQRNVNEGKGLEACRAKLNWFIDSSAFRQSC
jgi:hypothetical protein